MNVHKARESGVVAVTVASTPVLDRDISRLKFILTNDGANVIYVQLATDGDDPPTAILGEGIRLEPNGGSYTEECYTGAVAAIAVTATTDLCVVEL